MIMTRGRTTMIEQVQSLPSHLLVKYPWLESAKQVLATDPQLTKSLDLLSTHPPPSLSATTLPRTKLIIEDGLMRRETLREYQPSDVNNLLLFPLLKLLLSALKNNSFIPKVANTFSKYAKVLRDGEQEASTLLFVAKDIGWDVVPCDERLGTVPPFKMAFNHYIAFSSKMRDPVWKLTNQKLRGGYVYLERNKLTRLFEEYCKKKILDVIPLGDQELKNQVRASPLFHDLIAEIEAVAPETEKTPTLFSTQATSREKMFPPCVRVLYQKSLQGINMTHVERLFFATFLLNIGFSLDDVLDLYRNSPDFNERLSRYQIEHAAGEKGKGTKYYAHGCPQLESYQLCYADDPTYGHPWCAHTNPKQHPIASPFDFARRMAWYLNKSLEERI